MSVRLMVLGVVAAKPGTHGYEVQRELKAWRAETWSQVRSGSIYHALGQLEKDGHLRRSDPEPSESGPARTRYTVTPQGAEELPRFIRRALVSLDQEEFTAGIAFMSRLGRPDVIGLVEQRRDEHEEIERYLQALPREADPSTPATHPEIIGSWEAGFRATKEWLDGFLTRLRSGAYLFEGESRTDDDPHPSLDGRDAGRAIVRRDARDAPDAPDAPGPAMP